MGLWIVRTTIEYLIIGSGIRKIMSRQLESYGINILQLHVEWLVANGYKLQASSCKKQIRMILINKKKKEKQQATSFKLQAWHQL